MGIIIKINRMNKFVAMALLGAINARNDTLNAEIAPVDVDAMEEVPVGLDYYDYDYDDDDELAVFDYEDDSSVGRRQLTHEDGSTSYSYSYSSSGYYYSYYYSYYDYYYSNYSYALAYSYSPSSSG